jgi:hypothetical protein
VLKVLCYIEDRGSLEYIAVSDSGRLAARTKNPLSVIPEIQDLERVMQAKLDAADPKPEGLANLVESIHQYNETVATYERVKYVKTVTPELAKAFHNAIQGFAAVPAMRAQQNANTVLDMELKVVKVEKDGE